MKTESLQKTFISLCRQKIMDLLALRDHSVKELKTKLKTYLRKQAQYQARREDPVLWAEIIEREKTAAKRKATQPKHYKKVYKPRLKPVDLSQEKFQETLQMIDQIIEAALVWAEENNWLKEPEEVSTQVAKALSNRKKGIHFINQKLAQKGLPAVKADQETELQKARELLQAKLRSTRYAQSENLKMKLTRFLSSRGFSSDTIRKALHEELRSP